MNKASQRTQKWQKEHYDNIQLKIPKGDKERIKEHAEIHKESMNGFIRRAIEETIERDNRNDKSIFKDDT